MQSNSKQNVTAAFYKKWMVEEMLQPFLETHYPDRDYVFWPDNASSHYAEETQEVFRAHHINFVELDSNPPAMPQLRPIEVFWAHLKGKVYENGARYKTTASLKKAIEQAYESFTLDYFERLFINLRRKIAAAANVKKPVFET